MTPGKPTYKELEKRVRELEETASEHERTKRELQRNLGYLEKLTNALRDAVFTVKMPDRLIEYMNAGAELVFGYAPEECIGRHTGCLYPDQESYLDFGRKMKRAMERGDDFLYTEHTFRRKSGERFLSEITATFLKENGEVTRLISIVRDITHRKTAEEELRQSEERFRATFDRAGVGMAIVDLDGRLMRSNKALQEMLGYDTEELTGMPFARFTFPEDLPADSGLARQLFRGERDAYTIEKRCIRKDGGVVWGRLTASLVRDGRGRPSFGIGMMEDITGYKRALEALKESEEKFRSIAESAVDYIFIKDASRRYTFVNEAMLRLLGMRREDILGKTPDQVFGTDQGRIIQGFDDRAFSGDIVNETREVALRDKRFFLNTVEIPLSIEDGNVVTVMGIVRDVTENRRVEEEKKRLEAQLRQAQKMEGLGTLAGGIAHDFNNILSSIIGYTELALEEADKGTRIEDDLKEVYAAGRRARDLVRQILAFARRSDETPKPIRVDAIAREVLKLIRSTIPTTIDIRQDIQSRSAILGSPSHVHQLFMNLCTNAAQAMESEGGVLTVGLKDVYLGEDPAPALKGLKPGRYLRITVSDTGPGIPEDIIDTIFEPYVTTKERGEGTGLGLSVVHGIVEIYGGRILADSEPGAGAVFTIYFPVSRRRASPRIPDAELSGGTERVLFVDDEIPIIKMATQLLRRLGYQVTGLADSMEALERFRSHPHDFDLVITDMTMPRMTGDKLAVELMNIRPDIPVILCTGYSRKISEQAASNIGIRAFAYKPIEKAAFAATIRNVLDRTKSVRDQ